jgi:8-oxo-dGTP diphosphatase
MTVYCVGFMFSPERDRVVLLQKAKPAWMAGKLNGVGGKVEQGETPYEAMVREFREETGVQHDDWRYAGRLESLDSEIHIFLTFSDKVDSVKTTTAEPVDTYDVRLITHGVVSVIPNLRWIIPYLLDRDESVSVEIVARFGSTHNNGLRRPATAAA